MTSISAASTGSYLSPLDLLKQELQSEVASGKVSSTDQSALSSALDDIDSALTSQRQADSTGSSKPPGDMQSKIDDLIAGEVSSGKLTSDQATELKTVFANAFANGGPGGPGGPPPSDSSTASDSSSSTDSTDSTSSSSSSSSAEEMLKKLLEALQASLSQSSSYSASGGSNSSSPTSLLVDYKS